MTWSPKAGRMPILPFLSSMCPVSSLVFFPRGAVWLIMPRLSPRLGSNVNCSERFFSLCYPISSSTSLSHLSFFLILFYYLHSTSIYYTSVHLLLFVVWSGLKPHSSNSSYIPRLEIRAYNCAWHTCLYNTVLVQSIDGWLDGLSLVF